MPGFKPKRILVAPLDWGLGHATRCIPVIEQLLEQKCDVFLAGEGNTKTLLAKEFPQLQFLNLPGYHVNYTKHPALLPFGMLLQLPKIVRAVNFEKKWLQKLVKEQGIDAVISDNRYGLNCRGIPCVFITHQLRIKGPAWAEHLMQKTNYSYINQYTECWVPDYEGQNNLSGELGHPQKFPDVPVHYVGPLSRFAGSENDAHNEGKHLLVMLSGPEPQRTLLENLLIDELQQYSEPVVLIRGLPGASTHLNCPENVEVYSHLPAQQLKIKMQEAKFIVSRCGYSTVMDIAALQKKGILIPTPGQTEQQYLARHLMDKNFSLCIEQNKFRLREALNLGAKYPYKQSQYQGTNTLEDAIINLLSKT